MARSTNARIAGFTFLLYIVAGMTSLALLRRATGGDMIADKLASIAGHATAVGVLPGILTVFSLATSAGTDAPATAAGRRLPATC